MTFTKDVGDFAVKSLAEMEDSISDPARRVYRTRNHMLAVQRAINSPARCPFPVIAAVHGPVIGLGIDVISACDVRYAASNAVFSIKVRLIF
jgi:delta(3,5)-delta(2,4)-dienoyl-CoA isomerase